MHPLTVLIVGAVFIGLVVMVIFCFMLALDRMP